MLAARLYGQKDIRVEEVKIPEITQNEILIKVESASICGTDVRMYLNGYEGVTNDNPRILGHEFCGRIYQVGDHVDYYQEGMRVLVAPNIGCGICDMCVQGFFHQCKDYTAFGINIDGAFAEFIKIPQEAVRQGNICVLDAEINPSEAALNEPLSCAYNGIKKCDLEDGNTVLIIGAGPIGIMHSKIVRMLGASKVIVTDLSDERLAYFEKDKNVKTFAGTNLDEYIMDQTKGKGVDVCIVACPSPQAQSNSLSLMSFGGRINFFGGLPKTKELVQINSNIIHYNELIVTGSSKSSTYQFRKTLRFITEDMIQLNDLITYTTDIKDFKTALDKAKNGEGLKNVIAF